MLNDILGQINDLMYTYLLLFLLLGTGLYFSIRSRFAQVRLMKEGFRILTEKAEVEISQESRLLSRQADRERYSGCG